MKYRLCAIAALTYLKARDRGEWVARPWGRSGWGQTSLGESGDTEDDLDGNYSALLRPKSRQRERVINSNQFKSYQGEHKNALIAIIFITPEPGPISIYY